MQIDRGLYDIKRTSFDWADSVLANRDAFVDAIDGHAPYRYSAVAMIHNIVVADAMIRRADHPAPAQPKARGPGFTPQSSKKSAMASRYASGALMLATWAAPAIWR